MGLLSYNPVATKKDNGSPRTIAGDFHLEEYMNKEEEKREINKYLRQFFLLTGEPLHIRIFGIAAELAIFAFAVFLIWAILQKI